MPFRHPICYGILMMLVLGLFVINPGVAQPGGQASGSATAVAPVTTFAASAATMVLPAKPALEIASGAPRPIPETVRLDRTGTAPVVLFLHELHESRQSCKDCHGGKEPLFPKFHSPRGYTMAEMNAGKFCGKCHDGKYAYDVRTRCDLCHYKP